MVVSDSRLTLSWGGPEQTLPCVPGALWQDALDHVELDVLEDVADDLVEKLVQSLVVLGHSALVLPKKTDT